MATVFVNSGQNRRRQVFFSVLLSAVSSVAAAQTPVTLTEPTVADQMDVPHGRRSYHQASMTTVRAESFLKGPPLTWPAPPEGRGALGKRRDALLSRHYARLAELDALADEAGRNHDPKVAEQVETARRRDTQQFFLAMQALKVQSLAAWAAGGE